MPIKSNFKKHKSRKQLNVTLIGLSKIKINKLPVIVLFFDHENKKKKYL